MNKNYLLKMKPNNDYITAYLHEIKEFYKKIKEESVYFLIETSLNTSENYLQYNKRITEIDALLNQQHDHIQQLFLLNNQIAKYLTNLCNHEWFIDNIDIDPDTSKTIEYCKICGATK
jgi:cell division protein ZapA (FtsZ GTPase activity inhibitor)